MSTKEQLQDMVEALTSLDIRHLGEEERDEAEYLVITYAACKVLQKTVNFVKLRAHTIANDKQNNAMASFI